MWGGVSYPMWGGVSYPMWGGASYPMWGGVSYPMWGGASYPMWGVLLSAKSLPVSEKGRSANQLIIIIALHERLTRNRPFFFIRFNIKEQ